MPLVGVKCCQTGKQETFEHCMDCALTGGCIHPFPLIAFMKDKDESRVDAGLSVTQLLGCPRQSILKEQVDYSEDPANMWAMFRGSLGHEMMGRFAKYVPEGFMEERLIGNFWNKETGEMITLSGQPDWVVPVERGDEEVQECIITDFKSVGSGPKDENGRPLGPSPLWKMTEPKSDHVKQVHLYAALLWSGRVMFKANLDPKSWWCREGRLVYFDMDGSKTFTFPVSVGEGERLASELTAPFAHHKLTGTLPPVLPSRVVTARRTPYDTQVHRHPLCGYCPVRQECDRIALEEASA